MGEATVFHVGIQMFEALREVHNHGFVHCDLKPDNFVLGSDDVASPENAKVYLIDFGIAQQFIDTHGRHIARSKKNNFFKGNLLFASKNAFHSSTHSRRDDCIAALYLLVFMLRGYLPW